MKEIKLYKCPVCGYMSSSNHDTCPACQGGTHKAYAFNESSSKSPCEDCNKNPKNGGDGICHCTLGNRFSFTD